MAAGGLAGTAPTHACAHGSAWPFANTPPRAGSSRACVPAELLPDSAFVNARCFSNASRSASAQTRGSLDGDKDQAHLLDGGADVAWREGCGAEVKKCEDATSDRWCRRG